MRQIPEEIPLVHQLFDVPFLLPLKKPSVIKIGKQFDHILCGKNTKRSQAMLELKEIQVYFLFTLKITIIGNKTKKISNRPYLLSAYTPNSAIAGGSANRSINTRTPSPHTVAKRCSFTLPGLSPLNNGFHTPLLRYSNR